MTKTPQPRYSLTVSTKDVTVLQRRNDLKAKGYTDEAIYFAGVEALEKLQNA